ncbi:uncharacterized protein LOC114528535 [Dendronephthya gigantea]|uniref:uncharacterized protein LOC114528535 n=1 Tax=Dendronephthya gigantea TaxID=151771 RepID=UPI00106947DC|nr:uncharacterized protein LOC114528535 [Dendronephthya gigantea]
MKVSHLFVVFLANFCLSALALPAILEDYKDEGELDGDFQKRDEISRRGVSFGTALGHGTGGNNKNSQQRDEAFKKIFGGKREIKNLKRSLQDVAEYMNDLERAYMSLAGSEEKRELNSKRAPFTFGTALGHNQGKDKGDYLSSLNAKFNELFGDS